MPYFIKKIMPNKAFNRFIAIFMSVILCFTIVSNNTKKAQAFDLVVTPTVVAVVACILVAIGVVDLSDGSADIATTAFEFAEDCIDKGIDIVSWCNDCLSTADEFCEDVAKKGAIAVSSAALTAFVGWFNSYLTSKNMIVDVSNSILQGVEFCGFEDLVDIVNDNLQYCSYFNSSDFSSSMLSTLPSGFNYIDKYKICSFTYSYFVYTYKCYGIFYTYDNNSSTLYGTRFYSFKMQSTSSNVSYSSNLLISNFLDYFNLSDILNFINGGVVSLNTIDDNGKSVDLYDFNSYSDWVYNPDYVGEFPASTATGIGVADSNALSNDAYVGDVIDNYGKDWTLDGTKDGVVVGAPLGLDGDIIDENWKDKMVPGFGFPDVIDRSWTDVIGGTDVVDPDIPSTDVDTPDYTGVLGGIKSLIQSLLDALNGILDFLKGLVGSLVDAIIAALSTLLVALFVPDVAITDRVYNLIHAHIPILSPEVLLIDEVVIPDIVINGVTYVNNKFLRDNITSFRLMLDIFISFIYIVHLFLKVSRLLGRGE